LENSSYEGSPFTVDRGFGLRANIAKGDSYMVT
jgi:hypothetical protein